MELEGRVALVSGAAGGIGGSIASRFRDEGAEVICGDVADTSGLVGGRHLDVTDPTSWAAAVGEALERQGRLDILVNNAGILRTGSLRDLSLTDAQDVLQVNQVGCLLGMHAVIDAMSSDGGGSIINLSSVAGMVGLPYQIAYAASKWAIRGMTKCAARELAELGIRVNSIHPGPVDTPMMGDMDAVKNALMETLLIKRIGRPQDIAEAALFFASDRSSYVTAAELVVDGGYTAGPALPDLF